MLPLPRRHLAHLTVALAVVAVGLPGQRPRSADEALARFEQVRSRSEGERRRAVDDLGAFAEPAVTAVLLAELQRAQELGFRQTVVRAIGKQPRDGVVPALQEVLASATNPRLADTAAEGLARQGDLGTAALAALLEQERAGGSRWNSICSGLGSLETPAARDALLGALRKAADRERLGPLRNLRRWSGDSAVDEVRLLLARDKDPLVAATALQQLADQAHTEAPTLALELHRRLGARSSPEQYAAVLHGLLLAPSAATLDALLASGAVAQDPFAPSRLPLWQRALGDATFVEALAAGGPGRKSATERALAAAALGHVSTELAAAAADALVQFLGQRDAEVVRAAATTLVAIAPERAVAVLPALLASGADPVPAIALEALHSLRSTAPDWPAELLPYATGRTPGVRSAALHLLARCERLDVPAALAAAKDGLGHKVWHVRAAAIALLLALRTAEAVPVLFERLDAEQARLRADLIAALKDLTGQQFPDRATWRAYWAKEGAGFTVRPPSPADDQRRRDTGTAASYWDLPVVSDRVVFVVDVSGSMNQPFGTGDATRLDEAKRQLARVFAALPAKAKANVVTFGNGAEGMLPGLQPVDDRRRKSATEWANALEARGATNVHAALRLAFADAEVDTIFVLTDGHPSAGPIVDQDQLAREVERWNVDRGIRIHTVALGGRSDFLARLAADSGGEHTVAR